MALTAPQHIVPQATQDPIIAGGAEQPVPLIRAQQVVTALAVDVEGLLGRAQGIATRAGFRTQGQGMIPRRQATEVERHGLIPRQQPVAIAVGMADALAMLVHHLGAAQILDADGEFPGCRIDHAGAQVERHPGPLQGMDVVGTEAQLRIVRRCGHLDADLGAVAQRAARPRVAQIRGGDGQVVLAPEVLDRLIVQVAIDEAVEIIERPHQGDLAGARPLHRDGARRPEQGQHAVLDPQHHGDGGSARIHVLHADPGEGQ
ncbi:hypothetical protein D3C72_1471440 [compost metagenome]